MILGGNKNNSQCIAAKEIVLQIGSTNPVNIPEVDEARSAILQVYTDTPGIAHITTAKLGYTPVAVISEGPDAPTQGFTNDPNINGEVVATGDGVQRTFAFIMAQMPVIVGSLVITDGTETLLDNGDGTLTGDLGGTGTINYNTGNVSVTFNTAPTNHTSITANYRHHVAGIGIGLYHMGVYELTAPKNINQAKIIPFGSGYNLYCRILYFN